MCLKNQICAATHATNTNAQICRYLYNVHKRQDSKNHRSRSVSQNYPVSTTSANMYFEVENGKAVEDDAMGCDHHTE